MYAHMFQKRILPPNINHPRKSNLRDHSPKLAACGRHTVRCGAVTGREDLSGNDERRCVRTEVLEEVGEAVEEDEGAFALCGGLHRVVAETLVTRTRQPLF